jgi:hypothetical protein
LLRRLVTEGGGWPLSGDGWRVAGVDTLVALKRLFQLSVSDGGGDIRKGYRQSNSMVWFVGVSLATEPSVLEYVSDVLLGIEHYIPLISIVISTHKLP